ncbi:hypothetical protein PVAP13_5KG440707 [Panicum virgatum]|uniref:Uncharacterized protein n=1 Tax=Panicum virgatum TaxID=38727 RepID=A0A8T0STU0_PANVG|nr:hypothetical protein PVAP13_5KG440707 [Panicum virgatum]
MRDLIQASPLVRKPRRAAPPASGSASPSPSSWRRRTQRACRPRGACGGRRRHLPSRKRHHHDAGRLPIDAEEAHAARTVASPYLRLRRRSFPGQVTGPPLLQMRAR